jgi:hypothetical protein
MDYTDVAQADLVSALSPRILKVLAVAEENGWTENDAISLVIRLNKPDDSLARPFFMRWDLHRGEGGKRSWRFQGARASNGQALNLGDALVYLEDTSVIHPEPPDEQQG